MSVAGVSDMWNKVAALEKKAGLKSIPRPSTPLLCTEGAIYLWDRVAALEKIRGFPDRSKASTPFKMSYAVRSVLWDRVEALEGEAV